MGADSGECRAAFEEQVVEHLHDAPAVGHRPGQVRGQVDEHGVAPAAGEEGVPRPIHQRGHLGGFGRDGEHARLDTARIEQRADETAHVPGLFVDDAVELVHLRRVQFAGLFQQRGGRALDGGERSAQLVAHHAEELRAQPLQLLERREILQGDDHRADAAVVGVDGRGVDQRPDAAPVRDGQHDLFGAQRLAGAELLGDGDLAQGHLAAVGAAEGHCLQQLIDRTARGAQALADAPRFAVERHRTAAPGIEHHDADRRGLDQRLEVGAGALLVAVRARVGDRGRRLRGEQHQHLLILGGELRRPLLLGKEEVADMLAAVAHRHALEGLRAYQLLGEAEGADEGGEVGQADRTGKVAELRKQAGSVRPLGELPVLLRREARREEVLDLSGPVDCGDEAVARAGQRAGAVDRLLQDGGDLEARTDAQDRRAERGDPRA